MRNGWLVGAILYLTSALAAQADPCEGAHSRCDAEVSFLCLNPAAQAAAAQDCTAQFDAYRQCLAEVSHECGGPGALTPPQTISTPKIDEHVGYIIDDDYERNPRAILWAEVKGLRYQVETWEYDFVNVLEERDFNADGRLDALILAHGGGNCCPPRYAFVAYLGEGHFNVAWIDDIYAWEEPSLELRDGRWIVRFVSLNEGMNTDDFEEIVSYHTLEGEKAVTLSASKRREVAAEIEIRSSVFDYDAIDEIQSVEYDMNGDGAPDTLRCGFWSRWGRLSGCSVVVAGEKAAEVDAICKRLGVLSLRENGRAALVCDADSVLVYRPESNRYEAR